MRTILHVDMDAFFASVEQLDDASLRGRPVIVGGPSRRGVVCAASYEVRPFGVRSAMPMVEALRRCPHAVVVAPRHERYAEVSHDVFAIFRRYTPLVEGLSFDEAFLDVTESRSLFGDGSVIAGRIKREIHSELGLTASAGVAPSKFVAKIASDLRKPDGLVVVAAEDVRAFLAPLPLSRMWGVGAKTAPKLEALGLSTLGDLARADPARLEALLGSWGREIHAMAQGLDARPVEPDRLAKSVGAEETYEHDLTSRADIERALLGHAERVAQRLVAEGLSAKIVCVKLKWADFSLRTRRVQLPEPARDTVTIARAATELLGRFELHGARIRLTGISVTELTAGAPPPLLLPDVAQQKRERAEQVAHAIAERFGEKLLTHAALIGAEARRSR